VKHEYTTFCDWLTHLFLIRDVPGSYVGPEIGCPDRGFIMFVQPFRQIQEYYHKLSQSLFLPCPSLFYYSQVISSFNATECDIYKSSRKNQSLDKAARYRSESRHLSRNFPKCW